MAHNPELEARILADMDDVGPFLVYGDWLSERGDDRGELIAIQTKLEETPGQGELMAKEASLLRANKAAWLGDFANASAKDIAFGWRRGFLDRVRFGPALDTYETSDLDFAEAYAKVLALPASAFLRAVVFGSKAYDDYPTSWTDAVAAVIEHGAPTALVDFTIDRGGYWDISSTEVDLSGVYPRFALLRTMKIALGSITFGAIALPELRSLEVETGGLTQKNIGEIIDGALPALERLSLCLGEGGGDYGCDVTLESLAPIFEAKNLSRVRHLGLANSNLSDRIAAELVGSKILRQLETLDLSRGTFGDDGARVILDNKAAFAHLKTIDLDHHYVTTDVAAELAKVGPTIILTNAEEGDEDGDETYRYVQIGE